MAAVPGFRTGASHFGAATPADPDIHVFLNA
jgi:hypothetical protein